MICVHCGKEIENGSAFCPYCGAAIAENTAAKVEAITAKLPRKPGKRAIPVAAAALLVVGGIAFANRTPTINLNKYVTLSAEGYDSLGKLDVEFDTDKLEKDYGKTLAKNLHKSISSYDAVSEDLRDLASDLSAGAETELFELCYANGTADKTTGLSNGDVVTYSWNVDAKDAKEAFGVNLKYSDITYTVSGLEDVGTFDAFDGVSVEFTGTSPNGEAHINNTSGNGLYYTLDESYGLRNGDTVTLKVSSGRSDYSDCIDTYGGIPAETEKTVTVEGLNQYITSADDLTETALQSLQAQAEDVLNAYVANKWDSDTETFNGMEYLGDYILTPKAGSVWTENNIVTLAYKVNVHDHCQNYADEVYDADNSYYWYISFKNVSTDGNGEIVDGLNDYSTPDNRYTIDSGLAKSVWSYQGNYTWDYKGYSSLDELYSNAVTRNIEDYNHLDNVNV